MLQIENNQQIELLNKVVDEFASATNIASVLVDVRGQELSKHYHFSDFCKTMRSQKETSELCKKCDLFGGLESSKYGHAKPYLCHAGLVDFATPVIINNQITSFILSGQVMIEDSTDFDIIQDEQTKWQNNSDLRKSHSKIKSINNSRLENSAKLLQKIIEYYVPKKIELQESDNENQRAKIKFTTSTTSSSQLTTERTSKREINKALTYIDDNIHRRITLEEVANHVFLNQHYFSKMFKKELNINFINYVNQLKVEEAKVLLVNSQLSIESIALQLGFSQPSYFCKVFKTVTKMTPINFRQASQFGFPT